MEEKLERCLRPGHVLVVVHVQLSPQPLRGIRRDIDFKELFGLYEGHSDVEAAWVLPFVALVGSSTDELET